MFRSIWLKMFQPQSVPPHQVDSVCNQVEFDDDLDSVNDAIEQYFEDDGASVANCSVAPQVNNQDILV